MTKHGVGFSGIRKYLAFWEVVSLRKLWRFVRSSSIATDLYSIGGQYEGISSA